MLSKIHRVCFSTVTILVFLAVTVIAQAGQFRKPTHIQTPDVVSKKMPEGARSVDVIIPIPRSLVEAKVREMIEKWNTNTMEDTLADTFHQKNRLLDVVAAEVPRDAKLRVLSIQGIQTLRQTMVQDLKSNGRQLQSVLSVTVNTQLEFKSQNSYVRLPGTNEFIIKVTKSLQ